MGVAAAAAFLTGQWHPALVWDLFAALRALHECGRILCGALAGIDVEPLPEPSADWLDDCLTRARAEWQVSERLDREAQASPFREAQANAVRDQPRRRRAR